MRRGEIYYIARRDTIGAEIMKSRPAIIVSNDKINATSEVVMVVYLTTQPKKELPSHVTIESSGITSTALCEHVDHVSTVLIGDYCGKCTAKEMEALDKALSEALGLASKEPKEVAVYEAKKEKWLTEELERARAERDRYAKMVDVTLSVSKV